jgi:hypothetical protein
LAKCNDSLRYFCGFQYVRYFSSWREKVHFNSTSLMPFLLLK